MINNKLLAEKLDEMVHDAKAGEAADINNGGILGQIRYLAKEDEMVHDAKAGEAADINNCGILGQIRYLAKDGLGWFLDEFDAKDPYFCVGCGKVFEHKDSVPAGHLSERLEDGDIFSSCECPDCHFIMSPLKTFIEK